MNVCVDVGNTRIKIVFFIEEKAIKSFFFNTRDSYSSDEYESLILDALNKKKISQDDAEYVIYSSVCPDINQPLLIALENIFQRKIIRLGPGLKTGLPLKVDNPSEIGNDLIADLVAAKDKYGYPCLVCDLGTASKILLIDKSGAFSSCVIMPGLTISANTLFSKAAQLPDIALETPKNILGKNTIDAMNNGIVYGHAEMISGLCKRYEKELGYNCKRIITGGNSKILLPLLDEGFVYDEFLCAEGLNFLIEKNNK